MKAELLVMKKTPSLPRLWLRRTAVFLAVAAVVVLAFGCFVEGQAEAEKERFTDQAYPRLQQIHRDNVREGKLQQVLAAQQKAQANRIAWPDVLIALAETKPKDGQVKALSVEKGKVVIDGQGTDHKVGLAWQQSLRGHPLCAAARLGKESQKDGVVSFQLVMEVKSSVEKKPKA